MIQIDNRQTRRCLLVLLSLVALTGARVRGQANPDDQPVLPGNRVVKVGNSYYSSLEEAIDARNTADFTAELATSITLSDTQQFPEGATLKLNYQTLTLYSGTELVIGTGKTLKITQGTLAGSLAFSGSLLIGADVSMPGVGVREIGKTQNLYRILVTLPSADGKVSNLNYGPTEIVNYARSGSSLCCWLPQSHVARMVTFSFQEQGSMVTKNFASEAITVTNHAAASLSTTENSSVVTYKAKAKPEGETGYTSYESVYAALNAVAAKGGDVQLLSTAPLGESVKVGKEVRINLDGNFLQASGTAALLTEGSGSVEISGGSLAGNLTIGNKVSIPATVVMAGCAVTKDGVQVYRVRLEVPAGTTTATYSYGGNTGTLTASSEAGSTVAYLWLPARSVPSAFTLIPQGQAPVVRSGLVVEANHDNRLDLRQGDVQAVVYDQGAETVYTDFLKALADVKGKNGSRIELRADVTLGGTDVFALNDGVIITIDLNGYKLIGGTGSLDATASGSAYVIKNGVGMGSVAGLLLVEGNVLIGNDILATQIGHVRTKGDNSEVFRLLVQINATVADGFYGYTLGAASGKCYVKGNQTCLWLPQGATAGTLSVTVDGDAYEAKQMTISPAHSNTATLNKPDKVVTAILYTEDETPGTGGREFSTFHDALEVAAVTPNCTLYLLSNVELSGGTEHPHVVGENSVVTIELNGFVLTGGNCWLQATQEGSAFVITDRKGTGSLTGTFRSEGNLIIDGHIPASKIGRVLRDATGTQYYRVQVAIAELDKPSNGFGLYTFDTFTSIPFYYRDKIACIWLPVSTGRLELTVEGKTYTAASVAVAASHANVATVHTPVEVARLNGTTDYTSLADALAAAALSGSDARIDLLEAAASDQMVTIDTHKLTIDLHEFTLTQTAGSGWNTANGGQVYLMSSDKGLLASDFAIDGNFCAGSGVSLNGTVTENNSPVYRVRFFLPEGTTSAKVTYGSQSVDLALPGENRNKQVIGYAFLQPSGAGDLLVEVKGTNNTTLTLQGVSIQAFHNNQFDMESGTNPVRVENDQPYNTFELALMTVNRLGGGTIILNRDIALSGLQSVSSDVKIQLDGFTLALSTTAAFDVTSGKSLVISDENHPAGSLYGTLLVNGPVYVSPEVRMAGMVIRDGLEVYRNSIAGLPVDRDLWVSYRSEGKSWKSPVVNGKACLWLAPVQVEHDQRLAVDGRIYEVTFLPTLPSHTLTYPAYPLVEISGKVDWTDATCKNSNVYLKEGAHLTIATGTKIETLHKVTMENDTEIECGDPILAEAGITYRCSFAQERVWEAFSLPYHARLIRSLHNGEVEAELRPYLANGTGGDFWLKTISEEGEFSYMAEEQVVANRGYIIAVPENLTGSKDVCIDFVSPDRQYLNRSAVALPSPIAGTFVQVAPGTLQSLKLERPFYRLSPDGTEYARVDASVDAPMFVSPFSSFLLSDARTMAANSVLRMSSLPTSAEAIPFPDLGVRAYGQRGGIRLVCGRMKMLRIYSLAGTLVWQGNAEEGSSFIPLPGGIYIVNREKVMVR